MKVSFLYGADVPTLFRLLAAQRFRVQMRALPDLLTHGIMASIQTVLSLGERWKRFETDPERPVFILGHWRSGTTHLHNLMNVDGVYQTPSTFEAVFPHTFLKWEKCLSSLFDWLGPGTRLMDQMALKMASPQEEELALATLGAPSSYLVVHFARAKEQYRRYISFEDASESEIGQWKQAHRGFLRKLVHKHGNERPLVLKSPANTARIPLLMEMYPQARFVHIHRHPLETIRSTLHLYDAWFQMANFQSLAEIKALRDTYVLDTYEDLHRCWLRDKALIPKGNLLEVAFADLKQNPISTLEQVYDFLGDGKLDKAAVENYLASISTYCQNQYEPLSAEYQAEIKERMAFVFEEWGYQAKKR